MQTFDAAALATFAQIGLGLAGFSGIGILLTRSSSRLQKFEVYRLGIMLGTTFGATFLALLPLALGDFGWPPETTCHVLAGVMALFSFCFLVYFGAAIRYMRSEVPEIVSGAAVITVVLGHGANLIAQAANATGRLESCVGVYSLGLMWMLLHGTYQFWRILFIRPRDVETITTEHPPET